MSRRAPMEPIEMEYENPRVNLLHSKWRHVWLMCIDRRRRIQDAIQNLKEVRQTFYSVLQYYHPSSSTPYY
jgi:hypothetical protein